LLEYCLASFSQVLLSSLYKLATGMWLGGRNRWS